MKLLAWPSGIGRHRGKPPAQLRTELDEAICIGLAQQSLIAGMASERTRLERQLDEAGIDLSGTREDLAAIKQLARHLEALVLLRDQQIDDLTRKVDIGVKAEHVIAKTQEIPVLPLHQSPIAATPIDRNGTSKEAHA